MALAGALVAMVVVLDFVMLQIGPFEIQVLVGDPVAVGHAAYRVGGRSSYSCLVPLGPFLARLPYWSGSHETH